MNVTIFQLIVPVLAALQFFSDTFPVRTVPLDNSNRANKPRIVSIRFSKSGSSNMSVFVSVLDFYADNVDILWNIFVLPAPYYYMALFITSSAPTFSKTILEITKNFFVRRSLECVHVH